LLTATQGLTGHIHTNGSGGAPAGSYLRIAQAQVTGWIGSAGNTSGNSGAPVFQRNNVGRIGTDPPFLGALANITVFRYAVQLDMNAGVRSVTWDIPLSGLGQRNTATGEREVWWYASMNESAGSIRGTPVVFPASIAPAPSSMALIVAAAIAARRRRRTPT
jgi:MYXO-CTERM domain-containing protein